MKLRNILAVIALIGTFAVASAQEYGLHFMREVQQSINTNPGFLPRHKLVLSLPSPHVGLNITGLNNAPLLTETASAGVYAFNLDEVVSTLDSDVNMRLNTRADIFGLGLKFKKLFITVGSSTRLTSNINLPQDFFKIAYNGNLPYLDQTLSFGPSIDMDVFQEVSLGLNYSPNRKIAFGARAKRLSGIFTTQMRENTLELTTDSDIYQMNLNANYVVDYYGANIINPLPTVSGVAPFLRAANGSINQEFFDAVNNGEYVDILRSFATENTGWAFDIGAEINLKDKLTISASVLDIGGIDWNTNMQRLSVSENFTFEGLDFGALNGDISEFTDTINQLVQFVGESTDGFSKRLPTRSYLSGTLKVLTFDVGALWYNEFRESGDNYSSIAFSLRKRFGNMLSVGAVYAYQTNSLDNLGVNAQVKIGPAQAFVAADNIFPVIDPSRLEATNFRAGVNVAFGTRKQRKYLEGKLDKEMEKKEKKKEKKDEKKDKKKDKKDEKKDDKKSEKKDKKADKKAKKEVKGEEEESSNN